MKNTVYSIQVLRGVAACLVVFFHSAANTTFRLDSLQIRDWENMFMIPYAVYSFFAIGVDLFFVISGFIMVYTSWDHFTAPGASIRFIKKRFIRIFPTYWVFLALTQAFFVMNSYIGTNKVVDWSQFAYSIFLFPSSSEYTIVQAWTLNYELYFYIIFACALLFKRSLALLIVVSFFWASCFFSKEMVAALSHFGGIISNTLLFEFIFGMVVGILYKKNIIPNKPVLLAGFIILLSFIIFQGWMPIASIQKYRFIYWGIPSALLVWICVNIERIIHFQPPRLSLMLGDASYTIYLVDP